MKKLSLLLAGVALVAFSMTSCKKEFDCTCSGTNDDGWATEAEDYTYTTPKMKKADAEVSCDAMSEYVATYYTDGKCEL